MAVSGCSGCSGCVQLEGVVVDLRGKRLGRCFIDFARLCKGCFHLQCRCGAVFVIIAVAECLDDAAVIVRAA